MYSVYAGSDLIGHTALESGDAPMGVAFGLFIPSDGYARVRNVCQQNHSDQSELQLSVKTDAGDTIPAIGVSVLDYTALVNEPEIQVNLIGVEVGFMERCFPSMCKPIDSNSLEIWTVLQSANNGHSKG